MKNPFSEWSRNFALLAGAVFSVGVFFGIQLSLFNNFIVERLQIEPFELGTVEALREVPGFLNVLFIALVVRRSPPLVAAAALAVMGVGIMAYTSVYSVSSLALFSLIWSIGFHCWLPLEQSLSLAYSPPGNKGKWLGQLRSVGSMAWLLTIVACIYLMEYLSYGGLFAVAGGATILGGCCLLFTSKQVPVDGERGFVIKRRYRLFYLLNFLQGCRKQMFITFAIFALVKVHGMQVETTMILVLVNQALITLTAPTLGRLVDRLGERFMLSASYGCLIFVFLGYAVIEHLPTLYALYCFDNLIFFGSIALTTYINKIASPEDLKPTLSMGITMNHLAAVAAPLLGGLAWQHFGYEVIFFSGAVMAFISLVVCQWINPATQHAAEPMPTS